MRLRVQAYGPSKSAKDLAEYLQVKRLLTNGRSKFRGRPTDVIINWGIPKQIHNSIYLNPIQAVRTAANKLQTFKALKQAEVNVPKFGTDCSFANDSDRVVARTTLTGHSGEGIVVDEPANLPQAPLYVEYVEKVAEYRAIVVGDSVVDFKQKLKKRDWEGERSADVWNHSNGYVFARNGINHPEETDNQAIKAIQALGLNYGAVDIIEDEDGNIYVLEVNTAFCLSGTTLELVGEAIKGILDEV